MQFYTTACRYHPEARLARSVPTSCASSSVPLSWSSLASVLPVNRIFYQGTPTPVLAAGGASPACLRGLRFLGGARHPAADQLATHKHGGNSTLHDGRHCAAGVRAFADTSLWRALTLRAIVAVPRLLVPARRSSQLGRRGDHPSCSAAHFSPAGIDETSVRRAFGSEDTQWTERLGHVADGSARGLINRASGEPIPRDRRESAAVLLNISTGRYATHNGKSAVKAQVSLANSVATAVLL